MKVNKVIYDPNTFGITGKSLKMLRNAIVDNIHDEILIAEVKVEEILSGFLILNKTKSTATWSGDGFRHDRGGEGGRGYVSAHKLIEFFGIESLKVYSTEVQQSFIDAICAFSMSEQKRDEAFLKAANKAAKEFTAREYKCIYNSTPSY